VITTNTATGRAIAQAINRRIPTAATRVLSQVRSCGICGVRVLRFPLPILTPPSAPYSSIIRDWFNSPISGRRTKWTQSQPTPQIKQEVLGRTNRLLSLKQYGPQWKRRV
jgi:hypothetical protein